MLKPIIRGWPTGAKKYGFSSLKWSFNSFVITGPVSFSTSAGFALHFSEYWSSAFSAHTELLLSGALTSLGTSSPLYFSFFCHSAFELSCWFARSAKKFVSCWQDPVLFYSVTLSSLF